jgi:hypothetical protein
MRQKRWAQLLTQRDAALGQLLVSLLYQLPYLELSCVLAVMREVGLNNM